MAESEISPQITDQIIPKITTQEEIQYQIVFKGKIQTVRNDIQAKFMEFFDQLQSELIRLLEKLDEIENQVLTKFKKSSSTLMELSKARENALTILKSNSTSAFLGKNIEMYDKEIEEIKTNSGINSLFKLNWNIDRSQLENICQIDFNASQKIPSVSPVKTPVRTPVIQPIQETYQMEELQLQLQQIAFIEDLEIPPPRDQQLMRELEFDNEIPLIDKPWNCPQCTFRNEFNSTNCDVCDTDRNYIRM